ncbi:hypothetical protein C8039_17585 [Halogeometricum sp. wsp3]|nr:hypothetical protein C8039_17585 [Halogeometricum sp. wsp3]
MRNTDDADKCDRQRRIADSRMNPRRPGTRQPSRLPRVIPRSRRQRFAIGGHLCVGRVRLDGIDNACAPVVLGDVLDGLWPQPTSRAGLESVRDISGIRLCSGRCARPFGGTRGPRPPGRRMTVTRRRITRAYSRTNESRRGAERVRSRRVVRIGPSTYTVA